MDPDSSIARMERTLWTVWCYITGAVNRFLRPEPANIVTSDPNSFQESAGNSEPADSRHTEGDASGQEVDEEQALATASLLSSPHPVVSWELCTTDISLGPDEDGTQYKPQLGGTSEREICEEGEGTREEEQFGQTGEDDAGLVITKDATAIEDKEKENKDHKLYTHQQGEEPDEEHVKVMPLILTDHASEGTDGSGGKAGAKEETQGEAENSTVKLSPITVLTLEEEDNMHIEEASVQWNKVDTVMIHEEVENCDVVLQLENKIDEAAKPVENQVSVCEELSDNDQDVKGDPDFTLLQLQMASDKKDIVSEDDEEEYVMAQRSESDEDEDEREEEGDESTLDEMEQGEDKNVYEASNNQTIDEEPEHEEQINTVTEDNQQEDILTEHIVCCQAVVQNAETELHTAEEQEDVAKATKVQTSTRLTDYVKDTAINDNSYLTSDISENESCLNKDPVVDEMLSREEDNKSYMEIACTTPSVTVKPEGETRQEVSAELKNIPSGKCEGQTVVSQELNSPTCEETQEGVPEYNNELRPDKNTTQRFLKIGDGEEIQKTQLPEEVETIDPESLQNSDCSTGAEYKEQEGTEDINKEQVGVLIFTDTELPQEKDKTFFEPLTQESGLLFEEEGGTLLVCSMKTEIEHSEKEFDTYTGLAGETVKRSKELQDGTKVEFGIDEGLGDSEDAAGEGHLTTGSVAAEDTVRFTHETVTSVEAEVEKMTETSFFQQPIDAINSDQNSNMSPSSPEDLTESGFLKQSTETEPGVLEDCTVDIQEAVLDMEETSYGVKEAAEDEMQNKNDIEILNQQLVEIVVEPIKESDKNPLTSESELSLPVESLETRNQILDEAFEISNEEMLIGTEAADRLMAAESKSEDLTVVSSDELVTDSEGRYAEETSRSTSGPHNVIDEEILDLWIQTALSENTDGMKQQDEPEPGQQTSTKIEPSNEEQAEISSVQTETKTEQLVESYSGQSGLVNDTEMASSTVESGFFDQNLCEWGIQNTETQLLKSTSTELFQGMYDMSASVSESGDTSELSTQQFKAESQDMLMEEATEAGQPNLKEEESVIETGSHPDSGDSSDARCQNQGSDKSQEKTDEQVESEETHTGSQGDAEGADAESPTKMSTLFKVEDEDELLEITVAESLGEAKHTKSSRSTSGSEASLEKGIISAECESQIGTWTESDNLTDKPQPGWSEDIAELNRVEVVEQMMAKYEDQPQVDTAALDFTAQRSRISLKNPHVRPPKDPRALLHMPSVEPTPSSHLPVKVAVGVPLAGLGIGIKLPGFGAGFPVLKKTEHVKREENSLETVSQKPETKTEDKNDTPKQDEAQPKPKWMPPRHPGFGNPLMSELKTKLKKTTKE
uniref:probable serine/threonine-protein kinase kinX isoform X2 n=1 Tax=Monopterus albus TaxID=43700 RepID=UPI0009B3E914|nr:probable serine/threonine-protein kinase kinX isoform X2 [Monopterus albus]